SLKTSIKTITYLSDIGCLEIQGASLLTYWSLTLASSVRGGREGKETGMFIHHHSGLMYMLSFLTLVSDGRLQ
ncbi:hypothetical protein MZE61_18755, partial [Escherichia coli]|nr:hypothetical protein [Escherichia coli]